MDTFFIQPVLIIISSILPVIMRMVTFLINGKVLLPLGITAGVFCIAGHYIGSGMVVKSGQKVVRPVVLAVLLCLFVKIVKG